MIRIGVADDQQLIRDGIRLVLQLTDDLEVVSPRQPTEPKPSKWPPDINQTSS
jgi:DNA-binding NarL/FixJ family response regulator